MRVYMAKGLTSVSAAAKPVYLTDFVNDFKGSVDEVAYGKEKLKFGTIKLGTGSGVSGFAMYTDAAVKVAREGLKIAAGDSLLVRAGFAFTDQKYFVSLIRKSAGKIVQELVRKGNTLSEAAAAFNEDL